MCKEEKIKKVMVFVSIVFSFLILWQHHYVSIVFDDYGYASLSYGWTENQAGMAYKLNDIFKFLKWHYFNWGGRVLYFLFEILVLRVGGTELIQLIQTGIIVLFSVISGKIVAMVIKCDKWCCIALSLILYGTLNLSTLRDGVYWYSASVAYVWPLLPLLGSIWCYLLLQIKETTYRKCLVFFLVFAAAFSQEQVSVLVIVWIILLISFRAFSGKRSKHCKSCVPRYMYGMAISAILGGMITIMAPGNFGRADTANYDEFYSKSIFFRVVENLAKVININIGSYNWVFTLILTVVFGLAVMTYFKNKKIAILTSAFTIYFIAEKFWSISFETGMVARNVWAVCFVSLLLLYYYKRGNHLFLCMLIAGICSQGMMIVSPSISIRCHVPMEFILHLVVVECIMSVYASDACNIKKYRVFFVVCTIGLLMYATYNLCHITAGYRYNDEINKINHYKLIETKARYIAGEKIKEIDLYKLHDDNYANCMPYHEGFDYIEVWMKNYYELPQDIYFSWHNIEDTLQWYVKSGDYYDDHWLGEKAVFGVKGDEERILKIAVINSESMENQQLICTVAGRESIFDIPSDGQKSIFDIVIPAGNNEFVIQATRTFRPTNGDMRELSVKVDFIY